MPLRAVSILSDADPDGIWTVLFNPRQGSLWEQRAITRPDPKTGGNRLLGHRVRLHWVMAQNNLDKIVERLERFRTATTIDVQFYIGSKFPTGYEAEVSELQEAGADGVVDMINSDNGYVVDMQNRASITYEIEDADPGPQVVIDIVGAVKSVMDMVPDDEVSPPLYSLPKFDI